MISTFQPLSFAIHMPYCQFTTTPGSFLWWWVVRICISSRQQGGTLNVRRLRSQLGLLACSAVQHLEGWQGRAFEVSLGCMVKSGLSKTKAKLNGVRQVSACVCFAFLRALPVSTSCSLVSSSYSQKVHHAPVPWVWESLRHALTWSMWSKWSCASSKHRPPPMSIPRSPPYVRVVPQTLINSGTRRRPG